jgi:hypothetical protein
MSNGFTLPAANFLREINNMLYRERESARRHDEAMGSIGLRTANFKYQMEQDRLARQDREAARKIQQENVDRQYKLQQEQNARAEAQHKANMEKVGYALEEERKLRTPAPFSAYNIVPKNDPLWKNPEFKSRIEAEFGGTLNKGSGGIIGQDGKDKKYKPIDLRDRAPMIVGMMKEYKNDLSDTLINLNTMNSDISSIDTEISQAAKNDKDKANLQRLTAERSQMIKQRDKVQRTLTPTNILSHYRKEKDDFNRLAMWAQSKGLKDHATRWRQFASDNAKLELETVSKILVNKSGGEAQLKMAYDPQDTSFRVYAAVTKNGVHAAPVVNGRQLVWGLPSQSGAKDFGKYAEEFAAGKVLPPSGPNMVPATPEQVAASQRITTELQKITKAEGAPTTTAQAQDQGQRAAQKVFKMHNKAMFLYNQIIAQDLDKDAMQEDIKQWEAYASKHLGYIPTGPLRLANN